MISTHSLTRVRVHGRPGFSTADAGVLNAPPVQLFLDALTQVAEARRAQGAGSDERAVAPDADRCGHDESHAGEGVSTAPEAPAPARNASAARETRGDPRSTRDDSREVRRPTHERATESRASGKPVRGDFVSALESGPPGDTAGSAESDADRKQSPNGSPPAPLASARYAAPPHQSRSVCAGPQGGDSANGIEKTTGTLTRLRPAEASALGAPTRIDGISLGAPPSPAVSSTLPSAVPGTDEAPAGSSPRSDSKTPTPAPVSARDASATPSSPARTVGTGRPGGAVATKPAAATEAGRSNDGELEQVVRVLRSRMSERQSHVTIRLDPPSLGAVRISMDVNGRELALRIDSETHLAHRLLTDQSDELRSVLEANGIRLERLEIHPPSAGETREAIDGHAERPVPEQQGDSSGSASNGSDSQQRGRVSGAAEAAFDDVAAASPGPTVQGVARLLNVVA